MLLRVRFEDPLTINVNVTVTQKQETDKQILIELKNKLKASREKLIASFGENIKKSQ